MKFSEMPNSKQIGTNYKIFPLFPWKGFFLILQKSASLTHSDEDRTHEGHASLPNVRKPKSRSSDT